MPSTNNEVQVKYGINYSKTLSFSYKTKEVLDIEEIDLDKVTVRFSQGMRLKSEEKEIEIDFGTNFFYGEDVEIIEYTLRMNYSILNFEAAINEASDPKLYDIPHRLLLHLTGLTISTARGILIAHLMNTDYNNLFIPVFPESEIDKMFLSHLKRE